MKVLITGGLGFQGWHLTNALVDRGHDVTVLATPSKRSRDRGVVPAVVWGSVTDPVIVRAAFEDQDVVVHMAAMANPEACRERPMDAVAVNAGGTHVVLEALRALGPSTAPRLVHVSSCEVYGAVVGDATQDELAPMLPSTVYAMSKCAADRLVYAYMKTYDLRAVIVRPCNIYGLGQRAGEHGGVIPTMVFRALAGQPLQIRGDGSQCREFMHVSDVTDVYTRLVEVEIRPRFGAVNVSMGDQISVVSIAEAIAARLHARIEFGPSRPGEVSRFSLETSEARAFGLIPLLPKAFQDGLHEYITWAQSQRQ